MISTHYAERTYEISELEQRNGTTVRQLVGEAAVLLENKGVLPLSGPGKIALFVNAARQTVKGGTGSGCANSRIVVNIEKGLENGGFTIPNKKWSDEYDNHLKQPKNEYSKETKIIAEEREIPQPVIEIGIPFYVKSVPLITEEHIQNSDPDIAIYVLGRISGEGGDRFKEKGDYLLMDGEIKNLEFYVLISKKLFFFLMLEELLIQNHLNQYKELELFYTLVNAVTKLETSFLI